MAFRRSAVVAIVLAVVCTASGPTIGQSHTERSSAECDAGGESAALRRLEQVTVSNGEESIEAAAAADELVETLLRNGKGAQPSTLALAQRAVRLRETRSAVDPPLLAASLRNLADVFLERGASPDAVPLLTRAISIRESTAGRDDPEAAGVRSDLGYALSLTSRYEEARQHLDRALAVEDARLGPNHENTNRTIVRLVQLFHRQGKYAEARPWSERAVAGQTPAAFNVYGQQMWFEGRFSEARQFYLRASEFLERSCGGSHPSLAIYLRNLAQALARIGDLEEAVTTTQRALTIVEATLGPTHSEVAETLNALANRYLNLGDYYRARPLYERALAIVSKRSADERLIAGYLHNLALLNARLGDFAEARRKMDRAIGIWTRLLGPDHPAVANALTNLGEALTQQARYAEARPLYQRALAIQSRTLAPAHKDLVLTQVGLARACFRLGDRLCASTHSRRALANLEAGAYGDDLNIADAFAFEADLEYSVGDYDAARAHYDRALTIRERVVGGSNPLAAEARVGIGRILAATGDEKGAVEQAIRAEEIRRAHINITLRYLPERQSLDFSAHGKGLNAGALDFALSLSDSAGAGGRVFDALVRSRALVLDEMAQRRHVSTDASRPDIAALWTAVVSARQRYSNLVVRGPGDQRPDQYSALVNEARQQKETAEQALAENSASFRSELSRAEVGLDAVKGALPAGSALISFARYERSIVVAPARTTAGASRTRKPVASYIAFVTRAGDPETAVILLGPASGIDAVVAAWRNETTGILRDSTAAEAEKGYRAAGTALRRRVWDPLVAALKEASTIFVVPDGTLNLVSLAALPIGTSRYLVEQGPVIHYLSAERDLVANQSAPKNTGLLALGGAAFDDASSFTRAPMRAAVAKGPSAGSSEQQLRAACGSLQSMQFPPLEGTRREAREIASLWTDSPAQVLESRDANERAFKKAAPGHRVLHLATHGFFLGSDCPPAAALRPGSGQAGTRSIGGLSTAAKAGPKLELGEGPLLLSGLALAGANRRAIAGPDDEDGILTAEEVTALNLEGVEWAVLSACDTGLGEVKAGEGVFGLRRAFQVAGVRTVIMSLWPIDDQAARLWMRTLYERRLKGHLSTAEAMREASLSVLRARRARGQTTHPFYWAAFVATGAWQ